MTLTQIIKQRMAKRADIMPLPAEIERAVHQGRVNASQIEAVTQAAAARTAAQAAERGLISEKHVPLVQQRIYSRLKPQQRKLEDVAYRAEGMPYTPVKPSELAIAGAMTTLAPKALSHIPFLSQKPISFGEAAKIGFGPAFLWPSIAMDLISLGVNPFRDPRYRRGERGYLSSVREGLKGEAETIGRKGHEAWSKWGPLAVPIQVGHGIFNPISGMYYAGSQIGRLFGKESMMRAREAIDASLKS